MRSPSLRQVIPLRLSLLGTNPGIWREVIVDADLTLEELRQVVQSVFDGFPCRHHLFTDTLESPHWSHDRRRWGDRWTMIDFRDPTVIDAATARVGSAFRGSAPIFFTHTCDASWMVEIVAAADEMSMASEPRAGVVSGEGRSPFSCARGPYEHEVLTAMLNDPGDPRHDAVRTRIQQTVGPWGSYDPDVFDLGAAQRALEQSFVTERASARETGILASVVNDLPRLAQTGLRAHLEACALDLPVVVTADEAADVTRHFHWLIDRADRGDVLLEKGEVSPAFLAEGAAELDCHKDHVQLLVRAARQMRLLYRRTGKLLAKRAIVTAASSPTKLWAVLADSVTSFSIVDRRAGQLFLMAIADGSLREAGAGLERAGQTLILTENTRQAKWHDHRYGGYGYSGDRAYRDADCGGLCDCPQLDGATWHDVVAAAIRDAAKAAASGGAVAVAAAMSRDDLLEAGVQSEWVCASAGPAYADDAWMSPHDDRWVMPAPVPTLLHGAEPLIEVLSLLGLGRLDDGGWVVPPTLREFARSALQTAASRSSSHHY
ncbi:plasmid pRiA4b ORF-3 family protein [Microbacterium sp. HD4P20]|uniref:plasmid pRiA4b ORF-3 family protein n=1 Tax=Microbacterium sp. HD4P20 TaxID=2864874 RepID=UPI001C63C815|nr:plasmid pRiA4b ORF-3 family protein [Microbacterium sp. HD4P20]MCP2636455.1 plasmid pRiA4b ORF-3 family protein [Microbacterium sp. HD4P20]